ncbi:hypothetical protein PVAND_017817 [Polypedilum vanderplanki]|uniref:Integrase catalytic domain-containing protein n=1 Tax=Polypedilum vanderplanki TaxID=319348 RepID=A0A9J6B9L5_POLVA|nr:hypothetical protein PVAND_017817 [Polypedilum vanderplanki]
MTNWRENLAKGVQFYNNERTHSSTNTSPAELMFGRRLRASLPILSTDQLLIDDDVREIDTVNKHLGKEAADKRRQAKESEIEVGDTVFMRARNTDKLAARFNVEEPCKIVKKTGATVVIETKDGDEYRRNITAVKKIIMNIVWTKVKKKQQSKLNNKKKCKQKMRAEERRQ